MITKADLIKIAGSRYINDELIDGLSVIERVQEINTPLRKCHFLAQVLHESAGFKFREENLNYSESALLKVFPKYFSQLEAKAFARQPERIANRVYANRIGNGSEESGDGWRYRGRGYIQLTGKTNYMSAGNALGVDFVNNPELAAANPYAIMTAGWFWNARDLNRFADNDDLMAITKRINGGYNGLADRRNWLKRCISFLT